MAVSLRTAATPEGLQEVSFVNPNAQQARCHRRRKLAAQRARVAAMAACGGTLPGGGAADGFATTSSDGEKNVRKQKRMLRNRESAALSRKRKNDLIEELEIEVEALKKENRRLRQRVDESEAQAATADLEPLPTHRLRAPAPSIISSASTTSGSIGPPPIAVVSPSPKNHHFFDPSASPWGCSTYAAPAAAACFNIVSRPAVFA